ncbi:hypothetical protein M758_7G164900 [Ceratodon purpureus]|uniref:Dienelactone hydrolase domain-containing protein n=1 Tax=Ceratodon purpureus TaxID=3225 RepID=A0A8T0H707_CERPU|nr:hypothetical protein KC19_7G115100 [Ceratodon purpureus]KAG0611793.1 hypothetical protein M758_7G164900 [Ceratodon purpureus]
MATDLSSACCTPAPAATAEQIGKEETIAGVPVYITGPRSASAAVILISDVFGYQTPLLLKLADKVAAAGYLTLVPDLFHGDPFAGNRAGLVEWKAKHPPTGEPVTVTKNLVEVVKKTKGIDSVGLAGFCWGAKVAVCVGKERAHVKAVVQLHPSMVEASDYEQVAVPIAVLAAPTDGVEPHEALLASRVEVASFVKVFPGVSHGWAVRYQETDESAVKKASEAHVLMLDWFAKYL